MSSHTIEAVRTEWRGRTHYLCRITPQPPTREQLHAAATDGLAALTDAVNLVLTIASRRGVTRAEREAIESLIATVERLAVNHAGVVKVENLPAAPERRRGEG